MFVVTSSILIAGAVAGQYCEQNDMCGAGEKCYDLECVVSDGPGNMCGGPRPTDACYDCFECNAKETRCVPITDCEPDMCFADKDCERYNRMDDVNGQICYNNQCYLPGKVPGGCVGQEADCLGLDFFGCKVAGCYWNDQRDDIDEPKRRKDVLSAFNIASLESEQKGFKLDADGNIEYDEDGYAVLDEYAEMCGGPNADQECYECFECSRGGNRCIPISGCVPTCEVDDDCTREQICVDEEFVCRLPGGRPGGYRDSEDNGAGMGSERKGGKGNRGDSSDSSSWGGPELSAHDGLTGVIASLESERKGLSYDDDGNIEYDDEGYAVLDEYAEMCGGQDRRQECYDCFECSKGGNRCVPMKDCIPHCEVDEDCTREQICVNGEFVCRLPGGRPENSYRDDSSDDAGDGAARKGGKGNRGDSSDSSSWGGPALSAHGKLSALKPFNIASLENEEKGFRLDADGNIEYDEDGYAVLDEYEEMCGGPNADQECYECFECSRGGNRCIPISGCVPTCEVDDDCTREQICVDEEYVCRLPGGRPGGYRDSEDNGAGMGADRKGGKGNRGDSSDSSSWGGPELSAHDGIIASLESEQKGLSYDADGNIEYDEDGYAVLDEYAEMCGGRDADQECYECFECSRGGNRCIPISGCVPTCEVDDDCTREQICVDEEFVCRLPGGRPGGYRDSEDNGAGMGSERKGGKGNRGDSDSSDSSWGGPAREESVVMKDGGIMTMKAAKSSQSMSYLALLWCSLAAVTLVAVGALMRCLLASPKKDGAFQRSRHMVVGDKIFF